MHKIIKAYSAKFSNHRLHRCRNVLRKTLHTRIVFEAHMSIVVAETRYSHRIRATFLWMRLDVRLKFGDLSLSKIRLNRSWVIRPAHFVTDDKQSTANKLVWTLSQLTQMLSRLAYALISTAIVKAKVVPLPLGGRGGVAGFYAHHSPISAALCDGGAYVLSVAAMFM